MSIYKLTLNVGDRVRNIRAGSSRKGLLGYVHRATKYQYQVNYDNGVGEVYHKEFAHMNLEKVEEAAPACCCIHGEGATRHVLNRVRRNVITGKTQEEMIKICGSSAIGVHQFNTRALGRSTGQALQLIGEAMCNPNTAIRISGIDHALIDNPVSAPRNQLDKEFRSLVQSLIGNMRGFTFDQAHVTFNPIVTEETYVTRSN